MPFIAAQVSVASIADAGVARPDGVTLGITPGGLLYAMSVGMPADAPTPVPPAFVNAVLSIATSASLGILRPDDISVKISPNGVLYLAVSGLPQPPANPLPLAYVNAGLTAADTNALGVVWVDGTSIRIDANGVLSAGNSVAPSFSCDISSPYFNSYVCVDEAVRLLQSLPTSPGITTWLALSDLDKERTLVASTSVLDALNWAGCTLACRQPLQWPRRINCGCQYDIESIPRQIQLAAAYMAAYMGEQGGFIGISGGSTGGGSVAGLEPFDTVTVGPITVKMKAGQTYGDELTSNIGQIPPYVADLIRPFLNAFGAREGFMGRRSLARSWGQYIGSPAYSGTMYLRNGMVYPRVGGWASDMENRR